MGKQGDDHMTRNQEIARTIIDQLGGNRFVAMTGARNFIAGEAQLFFALPKFTGVAVNRVRITLMPSDTYRVEFYRATTRNHAPVLENLTTASDVYAEDLQEVFSEHTGLLTRLG
jgi:hypothetical protein